MGRVFHFSCPEDLQAEEGCCTWCRSPLYGAPGGARFLRVQVPNLPGSGKDIAEGKGVHCEVESEGSRMWGID